MHCYLWHYVSDICTTLLASRQGKPSCRGEDRGVTTDCLQRWTERKSVKLQSISLKRLRMTDWQYGKITAFIPHKLVKNSSNVYFVRFYLISSKNGHTIVGVATVCEPTGVGFAAAEQNSYTAAATFRLQSLLTSGTTHTSIHRILWFLNRLEAEDEMVLTVKPISGFRMGIRSASMGDGDSSIHHWEQQSERKHFLRQNIFCDLC